MSTTSSSPATSTTDGRDPGRAALRGGIFGYYADQFDIFVPILTLAPAMIFFQPADMSQTASALVAAAVFASTMVARPLGSAIFGHYADKVGRRITTMIAVGGFGIATLLIALLPGHQHIGWAAIVLLVGLRFVAGIFLGGEYSTAVPLAMEWTPRHRRGLASGLITCTSPAATASIAALSLLLLSVMSSGGLDTAYVQWGWRIPFVFGAVLALALFVYYRRNVEEAPTFDAADTPRSPLAELLGGRHRGALLQVFVLMTGTWTLTNIGVAVLPATLKTTVGLDDRSISVIMTIAPLACIGGFLACALLSQRFGRRPFYIGFGILAALTASTCYVLLTTLDATDVLLAGALATAIQVLSLSLFGPVAAYITERFPASIRATGYGVGYSLALVIPAFYAFYISGLSTLVGQAIAPAVLIVVGGALVAIGGYLGPETRDVDMSPSADRPSA